MSMFPKFKESTQNERWDSGETGNVVHLPHAQFLQGHSEQRKSPIKRPIMKGSSTRLGDSGGKELQLLFLLPLPLTQQLLFSEPVVEWKNEVSSLNESNMVWYCWDTKEVQHVPWLRGIYRVVGDTWDMRGLPNTRQDTVQNHGRRLLCMTIGPLRRSNLIWVGTAKQGKARAWTWLVGCDQEVTLEEHSGLFGVQHESSMEAEDDLACIGAVRRTRWPWKAEGLVSAPLACQPLPAGPTPASTKSHPPAKGQWLSLLSFQLNPCWKEGFIGMCISH